MIFYNFCYYFWGQHWWWTETNITGNDFLFFISFQCHKLLYCSPCHTDAPASLKIHVVSTNFAKALVVNLNMTSYCDVINSVYPITMTTIHRCSILAFGRGASDQAVAPGITRPLHASAAQRLENSSYFEFGRERCTKSRRHGEALMGLAPLNKALSPPKLKYETV